MPRPPLPPIIGNPMLLATGCAVRGCDETGVPRLPTDVTAGLTDGATPPHDGGTDKLPTSSALPSPPAGAPGTPVGRLGGITSVTLAAFTAGSMLCASPSTSLNAVVKSRVGEINRITASKPLLASRVCDPVRPSRRSPMTPPTTMPSPLEFQTCPVRPSVVRRLSKLPIHGGVGISPASAVKVLVTADCPLLEPTACATAEAWAPSPAGSAESAAVAKGASVEADNEAPA